MNKNIIKIIFIIILFLITMNTLQVTSNASKDDSDSIQSAMKNAKQFSSGEIEDGGQIITIDETKVQNVSNMISSVLLGIAVVVAVITTAILGMSFIVQSAEGKAKIKEALVPLVIGMIISFGAFTIWKFAINLLF